MKNKLGKTIEKARKEMGLKMNELADKAGTNVETLRAIIQGKGNPKIDTLKSVCDVLGIKINFEKLKQ